jgi:hypothetical protein
MPSVESMGMPLCLQLWLICCGDQSLLISQTMMRTICGQSVFVLEGLTRPKKSLQFN